MPINPAFALPIYYNKAEGSVYNGIQKELTKVHTKTEFIPLEGRPPNSHDVTPDAFVTNTLQTHNCYKFLKFLDNEIHYYLEGLGYPGPWEYIIDSSWLTSNKKNQMALEHSHGPADISGVYYLKTNGKDGALFFKDPCANMVGNLIMDLAVKQQDAPLDQGLIMMWPGFLSHGTRHNTTDDERISLSFNIVFARRGFSIKKNVDNTRAIAVRHNGWNDIVCYDD